MAPVLVLVGFAGLVAGIVGLAKGSLRRLHIASRKQAALATGMAFAVCIAGGAVAGPPRKAVRTTVPSSGPAAIPSPLAPTTPIGSTSPNAPLPSLAAATLTPTPPSAKIAPTPRP